ncbi:hypothetical protein HU200_038571 [Digitaria exilis]|uniref:Uncharacterized protein n=1 Tax=Digitaria exilis TaxID=1010633 RepID=A0A835BIC5_9POAL|nr:hypothetical protein HU200_038571 [Digitaria exilis]
MDWCIKMTTAPGTPCKAFHSLVLLVAWEVWKERNSRTFRHLGLPTLTLFAKIKDKVSTWIMAGTTRLAQLVG